MAGQGSLRGRGPNTFELRVFVGTDPRTGKNHSITRTFHGTKTDANKALAALVVEVAGGRHTSVQDRSLTLIGLIDRFLDEAPHRWTYRTEGNYRGYIDREVRSTPLGRQRAHAVTHTALRHLYDAQGSSSAVSQLHAVINNAFIYGHDEGFGPVVNPCDRVKLPRHDTTSAIVAPEPEVVAEFLEAAAAVDPMWATALVLDAMTGLRRGELVALRQSCLIDVADSTMKVVIDAAVVEVTRGTPAPADHTALPQPRAIDRGGKGTETRLYLKDPKGHASRVVHLDEGTATMLRIHRAWMTERASRGTVTVSPERLRDLRQLAGLTQAALADAVGLTGAWVSLIERGRRTPSVVTLERLAEVLGAEVTDIADIAAVEMVADPFLFSAEADGSAPWRPDYVSTRWRELAVELGYTTRLHDLRHYAGTEGALESSLLAVMKRLGQKSLAVLQRYVTTRERDDRKIANDVAARTDAARALVRQRRQGDNVIALPVRRAKRA